MCSITKSYSSFIGWYLTLFALPTICHAVDRLPWRSGVACSEERLDAIKQWRGSSSDIAVIWMKRGNWDDIRNPDRYGYISSRSLITQQLSISIATLPEDGTGSYEACAKGHYDQYFSDIGTQLKSLNRGDSIVRLGWEANGDWYDWSFANTAPHDYIQCFRNQAAAIKSKAPGIKIEWPMNNASFIGQRSIKEFYPGDSYVDIIGISFYDWWPAQTDDKTWLTVLYATENGGPRGIGSWLSYAKARGKKLAVSEWGVADTKKNGHGGDNPFYIRKMVDFFKKNAAHIAYESYFNCANENPDFYMIYPNVNNPKAASTYGELYRRAAEDHH